MNRKAQQRGLEKKRFLKLTALLTSLLLLVTGCGLGGSENETAALGRYVESSLSYPPTEVISQLQRADGTLVIYGWEMVAEEQVFARYESVTGTSWQREELELDFPEDASLDAIAEGPDGELYALSTGGFVREVAGASDGDGDGTFGGLFDNYQFVASLYEIDPATGGVEEIPLQWHQADGNGYGTSAASLKVLENGDFLIYQSFDGYCQYRPDGRLQNVYMEGERAYEVLDYAVRGTEIYLLDNESQAVLIYEGESGELKETVPCEELSETTIMALGSADCLLLLNSRGLYRRLTGGGLWEKLIDGELNSLSLPTAGFQALYELTEGGFLAGGSEEGERILLAYHYDAQVATVPQNELVVYTLAESKTLRQAAALYQRLNPDTKITIRIGAEYGGGTASDQVRALNTELLAGRGPDVLILDGLPVNSYLDQGMLKDVREVVQGQEDRFVEAVLHTYERAGGLYAIPLRFQIPAAFAKGDYIEQLATLEAAAQLAENSPEMGLLGNREAAVLLELLLPASAPAWLGEKHIDEAGLAEFLRLVKVIADSPAPSYNTVDEDEPYDYEREAFHWAFGRSLTQMKILAGYEDLGSASMAMAELGEGELTYLPGLAERVYIPSVIAAVNQNTNQPEEALHFLRQLLDPEVQKAQLSEGFPLNKEALADLQFNENMYMFFASAFFEGESLMGGDIPLDLQERAQALALGVKTPYTPDAIVTEMITDEAAGYFSGEKSLDQTISDIQERARLYLAE